MSVICSLLYSFLKNYELLLLMACSLFLKIAEKVNALDTFFDPAYRCVNRTIIILYSVSRKFDHVLPQ